MPLKLQSKLTSSHNAARFHASTPEDNVEYLFKQAVCKPCSLFGLCDHSDRDRNLSSGSAKVHSRPLHKGAYLFRQGEALRNIYIIRTGGIKLLFTSFDGTEQILNFYLRDDILGLGDIESGQYSCSAIALETTSVCKLPYDRLLAACQHEPRLYDQLFRLAARGIAHEHSKMILLGQKQSEERFASFILDLANRNKNNGCSNLEFNLSMSRHDIAKYLCLADETVSRMMTKFCNERLLEVSRRSIRICDHDQLARKAGLMANSPALSAYLQ
jgi:CRP/FNR family transcriptional regulator